MLDSSTLRFLWLIIEQAQTDAVLDSSDSEIAQHILQQLQAKIILSSAEIFATHSYIKSRIPLIRDLAEIHHIKRLQEKVC